MQGRFSFWIADMSNSHVRIVMTGPGQGKVYLNGEEVENVLGFEVSAGVGLLTTVSLEIIAANVELDLDKSKIEKNVVDVTNLNNDGSRKYACVELNDNDAMDNQE